MLALLTLVKLPTFVRQAGAKALVCLARTCTVLDSALVARLRSVFWHWRNIQVQRALGLYP